LPSSPPLGALLSCESKSAIRVAKISLFRYIVRNLLYFIDYFVVLPVLGLFPVPVAYRLARLRGRLRAWWSPLRTAMALTHAKRLLGGESHPFVGRFWEIISCDELDAYLFLSQPFKRVVKFIQVEGEEYLQEVRRKGKGAVLLSAHLGGGFFIFPLLRALGLTPQVIMRPVAREDFPGLIPLYLYFCLRGRCLARAVGSQPLLSGGDVREALKVVRQGAFLYITMDVPPHLTAKTRRTEFFGYPAHFPYGAFIIASRARVPVIPFFVSLNENNQRIFRFFEPIWLTTASQDIEKAFHYCVQLLEEEIRARPEQWFFWEGAGVFFEPSDG